MKICLFDIDGTLIVSGRAGQDAVLASLERVFGAVADPDSVPFAGRTDRAIMSDLFQLHGIPWTAANWDKFQQSYLDQLPLSLKQRSGQVLRGVRALLQQLTDHAGIHVGLLTGNVAAGAQQKLEHFQLWDFFAFGGFGDEHLSRDDVARAALRSAQAYVQTGVNPDDVWVIGDTPHDVQCGRAIGARAMAVATGSYSRRDLEAAAPDALLPDLTDTTGLIELLAGNAPRSGFTAT